MPVTFLAHQAPLAPLKILRPTWFDATALCAGSMTPDLLYAYTSSDVDVNHVRIFATHGLVLGLVLTLVLRYLVVPVAAAHLPDLGTARLRSLSVIDHRRPLPHVTLISLAIGLASHSALDWFTHDARRGPAALGYDDVGVTVLGHTRTMAEALQWVGHTVGGAAGVWVIVWLGRRRMLERWYAVDTVERARSWRPGRWSTVGLVATTLLGAAAGLAVRDPADAFISLQRILVGAFVGMTGWSLVRWPARRDALRAHDRLTDEAAADTADTADAKRATALPPPAAPVA